MHVGDEVLVGKGRKLERGIIRGLSRPGEEGDGWVHVEFPDRNHFREGWVDPARVQVTK